MKVELEISDELWKRIEHLAELLHLSASDLAQRTLDQHVPLIPDRSGAIAWADRVIADASNGNDAASEEDLHELLQALDRHPGRSAESSRIERNGVAM